MKNKILAIAMCTVIIASMLIIPTSADNITEFPEIAFTTEPQFTTAFYETTTYIGKDRNNYSIGAYNTGADPIYVFYYGTYNVCFISYTNVTTGGTINSWYGNPSSYGSISLTEDDGIFYQVSERYTEINEIIPQFTTLQDGIEAFKSYMEIMSPVISLNYSLPAGNAIYIELDRFQGAMLYATMPQASYIFGGSDPFYGANQTYLFTDTLPSPGPLNLNGSRIVWQKNTANGTAITGQTKNAYYDFMGPYPNSKYLVIVNPAYYGDTANGPYEFLNNPPITIKAIGVKGVHVYSLYSSVVGNTSGGFSVGTEITGDTWTGPIDPITGQPAFETTPESQPNPTSGGGNLPTEGKSINDWLENIAESISGFFNGAIGAINTLVSAISSFTGTLQSLYMWLPSPVYGLLTSAIMLAITIGVIKVFI